MSKTAPINMRVEPRQHALLDQRLFQLDEKACEEFEAALAEPVADNPRLRALLRESAPWES